MLTFKELQERTGYSKRMLEFITRGIHTPHPKKAKILERVTGVPRLAWLYPDEYDNPYVNGNGSEPLRDAEVALE